MNPENLKGHGFNEIPPSEQRAIARAGAKASAIVRRRKKAAKAVAAEVLSASPVLDDKTLRMLKDMGKEQKDLLDNYTVLGYVMVQYAMRGDDKAMRILLEMAGEDAQSRIAAERLKLDKERLKLEKERLRLETERAESQDYAGPLICDSMDDNGGEDA